MVFKMALRSIGSNKMRSLLTMLGIIIGVFSLVVLVSLVSSTTNSITNSVSSLGSSLITVRISDITRKPVSTADLEQWVDSEASVAAISPSANLNAQGKSGTRHGAVSLNGVTEDYAEINGLTLLQGRFLKRADESGAARVCVLEKSAAEELIGYADCVGQELALDGVRFKIVGVVDNDNSFNSLFFSTLTVYVPFSTLTRLSDAVPTAVTAFCVGPEKGFSVAQAEAAVKERLNERFGKGSEAFHVSSQNILEDTMKNITSVLKILLGGIAAISLIVGGVGIMNIMLVTVTERTKEIGIRKAIGASRRTILIQFLIEAVTLCMLGCLLGIFFSWVVLRIASLIVTNMEGLAFHLEPSVVVLSAIFCFAIGVIFGLYPANKAAKMKPIDALRYGG